MNARTGTDGPAIEVRHLRKTYGDTAAVDDVSFSVAEGEIFGLIGPNGAGKTATIECALGLRTPDSGSIRVLRLNPAVDVDKEQLHLIVGAQLQASALPALLRVSEILGLYRSFYRRPADVDELVGVLGPAGKRRGLSLSLRAEGADLGVKVSVVCPGWVRTPIFENSVVVNMPQELLDRPPGRVKWIEAAQAARVILDGVARNQAVIAFPGYIRLVWRVYRLFPRVVERGAPRQVREARTHRTAASG